MTSLTDLKNIGNTSALWLNAIGITDFHQLQEIGAVEAYTRIQERGIKVSKVLLYALEGALINVHWNDLEPTLKQKLLDEAEQRKQVVTT